MQYRDSETEKIITEEKAKRILKRQKKNELITY
jgi:hypothetical protein